MASMKMSPEQITRICEKVKNGVPIKYAVQAAGVASSSFYYYFEIAEQVLEKIEKNEVTLSDLTRKERKLLDFLEKVKEAKAHCIDRNCSLIQVAAASTWQAAAWWLERAVPESFARKDTINNKMSGELKTNFAMSEIEKMTKEQREELLLKLQNDQNVIQENIVEDEWLNEP